MDEHPIVIHSGTDVFNTSVLEWHTAYTALLVSEHWSVWRAPLLLEQALSIQPKLPNSIILTCISAKGGVGPIVIHSVRVTYYTKLVILPFRNDSIISLSEDVSHSCV